MSDMTSCRLLWNFLICVVPCASLFGLLNVALIRNSVFEEKYRVFGKKVRKLEEEEEEDERTRDRVRARVRVCIK